jgi:hypothetical protein
VSQGSGKEERVRSRYREEYGRNKKLLVVDSHSCRIPHAKSLGLREHQTQRCIGPSTARKCLRFVSFNLDGDLFPP